MSLVGIDCSNNNGVIDWPQVVAAGVQFALIKCSQGTWFPDPTFATNWQAAGSLGLGRAAYHYAEPDADPTALRDAQWFLDCLGSALLPGDGVMLDAERAGAATGDLSGWMLAWLQHVEQALGLNPVFYNSPGFIAAHNLNTPALAQYGLVLADWGVAQPSVPSAWPFWAIWQYSNAGSVPGIAGPVDLDVFNGDSLDQFRAYGLPAKPLPPFDAAAQYQLVKYITGGSGPADIAAWCQQFIAPATAREGATMQQPVTTAQHAGGATFAPRVGVITDLTHAIEGIPLTTVEQAGEALYDAFEATPATEPLRQRLTSRKFLATLCMDIGTVGSALVGGLPRSEAAIIVGAVTGVYLLSQAVVDAAAALNRPPPGTRTVPLPSAKRA